jgi:hypothetical protein
MKRIGRIAMVLSILGSLFIPISSASAATVYSFTSAGAVGRTGPTQTQVNSAYTGTTLASSVTINTQGIQEWVVPNSGKYQFIVAGAGGAKGSGGTITAGLGVVQTIETTLTAGTNLKIIVGQMGLAGTNVSGGGGGSFVSASLTDSTPLIASGGGGGGGYSGSSYPPGINASTSQSGVNGNGQPSGGGSSGAGGSAPSGSTSNAGAGAGWLSAGVNINYTSCDISPIAAAAIKDGGVGGRTNGSSGGDGGFGGGGASGVMCGAIGGGGGGGYSGGGPGSSVGTYGGGGGGGSYYSSSATFISASATNSGAGYVTITPLGPSLTVFSPASTITNSTTINYLISFSETVTGLAAGDFSKSGTGSSSCTIGSPTGSGKNYSIQLTGCSEGTVVLTMAANAVQNADPQYAPGSNTNAATVTIDRTAPTISSVTAPANATYKPSDTPTFTVNFSESVTVSGSPRLVLAVGASTEYATFVSLTDSKTALFRYTVATDPLEFDTDGISINTTLDLNGGAIADLATNAITDRTFTAPTLTSVLVAQPAAAPTIDSITATNAQLAIYFTAGAARGSTTSSYQYSANNGAWTNRPTGTTASPITLTGLTNGTGYTIRLRAVTNAGNSDSSTALTETPTAVSVSGDATLTLTYGNSASTGTYSATGGTGTYTWSLGSSLTGVTLSGTTVTASSSTPAGTYSQTVRATDGNSQVGSRTLTITVNKAASSITIALPNNATNAALGGAVIISATVPRAGSVNFKLDGTTISGCGSASAANTTATCTWTPGAMGSVSLTAIFTPTDSTNYESATSTSLSITVVTGESSVTLQLTGGVVEAPKGQAINIIATVDQAGRITFLIDGKRVPGCNNKLANIGNVTCSWKPAVQRTSTITARLVPTNNVYNPSTSSLKVQVIRRAGLR